MKFEHPYRAFVGAYTLMTLNNPPYPFNPPPCTSSGITEQEWKYDKGAMEMRTHVVTMEKSFNADEDVFPFTKDEFAWMMLSMYTYDDDTYPEYKAPFDINEKSP